ncbi:MAG TPA: DUF559 domain-containing protein [Chitinophagaceae bacterium]|jgi:very-short-patch-repair endonuclease|nr:DUF559 domain-containing protein [Chitinophagaceae bacterium]
MDKKMHRGALRALYQMARENRNNETHAERGISDEERQNFFENEGMDVLRFSNEEVLRDQEHVIESIEDYLRSKKQLNERQA